MRARRHRTDGSGRPIAAWKLIGGGFLHFGIIAYLVIIPALCLIRAPHGASPEQMLRLALLFSVRFLLALLVVGGAATALAAIGGAAARPRGTGWTADPRMHAERCREHLRQARQAARRLTSPGAAGLVARIETVGWDHEDPRFQALARDYAELLSASAAAIATSAPSNRAEMEAMAEASLAHIADEIARLHGERAGEAETKARIAAEYVKNRYGSSDSAFRDD